MTLPPDALDALIAEMRSLSSEAHWTVSSFVVNAWADRLAALRAQQDTAPTECCNVPITAAQRFCPKCGYEARVIP